MKKMFKFFIKKKNLNFSLILIVIFVLGVFIGYSQNKSIASIVDKNPDSIDLSSFWKTWRIIDEKYPKQIEITDEKRVYGAIKGLMDSLGDPYSVFFDPEESVIFEEDISGKFGGVGMEVGIKDDILTVIAPLKDTPAFKAGLESGDFIIKIDGKDTYNMPIEEALTLIRGEEGTEVNLLIYKEKSKKQKEVKIIRAIINIPTLDTKLIDDDIFVIELYSFSGNSKKLFKQAIKEFIDTKTDKLLLDLRGNPGGYLDASVDMASWFLPSGKPVVIEQHGTKGKEKIYRSHGYNVFNENLKLVILINKGSASASEILAGALQDYGKAKLVGEKSYGKGSVQEVVNITKDTTIKITIAEWLTPNYNSISEVGLTPDYEIKNEGEEDLQLKKAIDLLINWEKN